MSSTQNSADKYYNHKLEILNSLPDQGHSNLLLRTYNITVYNYNKIKEIERRLNLYRSGHESIDKNIVWSNKQGNFKKKPSKKKKRTKKR